MPFKKPSEVKAETVALAQRSRQAIVDASAERARRSSPLGRAEDAKAAGQRFFEVQITVSVSKRDVVPGSRDLGDRDQEDPGLVLGQIESLGWELVHVDHVFVPTGESSRDKFLASGQFTALSGETVGIYLFRTTDS